MDRGTMQRTLMARGQRLSEDDPLFVMLELNEILFEELVARHFGTLDQHIIQKVVSLTLSKKIESQAQTQQFRCVGGTTVEKAASRLESVVSILGQFEEKMSDRARDAARDTAREVAGQILKKLALEVSAGLSRLDAVRPELVTISESAKKTVNAAQLMHSTARRVEVWWLGFGVLMVIVLFVGMYLGHSTTTGAYERVQAACTAAKAVQ